LRRVPEGGTWALARDRRDGEALRQQAERLPELERPVVLVGEIAELPDLLALRAEEEVRFDAIVGRNALGPLPDKAEILRLLSGLLHPGGRLSLAETVVRHTQRLYNLVDRSAWGDDLGRRVVEAEEEIYANAGDPLVNWDAGDLARALESAGFQEVSLYEESQESEMLISQATFDRWFSLDAGQERPSYARHLLRHLSMDELLEVQALFRRQLAGQTVPWRTRTALLVGQHVGE
jgi:putative ATPase